MGDPVLPRPRAPGRAAALVRLDVGGFALRAETSGESRAPAFVCLHGLVDTLEIWDAVAPALAARGRLVRFDQRGHGESEAPPGPYDRRDLANDCITVLDRFGIERAILAVGHSMGGVVAMAAALARPERVAGLVLDRHREPGERARRGVVRADREGGRGRRARREPSRDPR